MTRPESTSAPALVLVHHHPGRLRVRADAFRASQRGAPEPEALARARDAIVQNAGLRSTADPFTGSLLIEYEPGALEPGALLAAIAQAAGLARIVDAAGARRSRPDLATAVTNAARTLDRTLDEVSGGRAHLGTLVPLALFAGAAYALASRPELPRWDNLLWWSYSVFRDLNATDGGARTRGLPDEPTG